MHSDSNQTKSIFLIGLLLVPNGKLIGKKLGDRYPREERLRAHTDVPGGRLSTSMNSTSSLDQDGLDEPVSHSWGVFFTVLGTVLLDFDADACQSPSRAYLLDVTLPGLLNYFILGVMFREFPGILDHFLEFLKNSKSTQNLEIRYFIVSQLKLLNIV